MLANVDGHLIEATSRQLGACPGCGAPVRGKDGPIVTAHWAHVAGSDCDPWSEPESPWHQMWKRSYLHHGMAVEVPMGGHRADVVTPIAIVELQHSTLSLVDAHAREAFYGQRMLWLWDMTDPDRWERVHFGARGFWWKQGSRMQAALRRPVFWHTPDGGVFRVSLNAVLTDDESTRVLGRVLDRYTEAGFLALTTRAAESNTVNGELDLAVKSESGSGPAVVAGAVSETQLGWQVECTNCRGRWLWRCADETQARGYGQAHVEWSGHAIRVVAR